MPKGHRCQQYSHATATVLGLSRKRWLREPLLHFTVLGMLIFLLYSLFGEDERAQPRQIVVSEARIKALSDGFTRTWLRTPSEQELQDLIEDHIAEEVYYREALLLGLDRDDIVIRRRLRQKMEFLSDIHGDAVEPTEAQLEAHFQAYREKFIASPRSTFTQVYFDVARGAQARRDAADLLARLRSTGEALDPEQSGDATLLPSEMKSAYPEDVAAVFGADFAAKIETARVGEWHGPFASPFGIHLVRVEQREGRKTPQLADVRPAVLRDWQAEHNKQVRDDALARLLSQYELRIEAPFDQVLKPQ